MFRTTATLIGMAGAAVLAGGLAPNAFGTASLAKSDTGLDRAALTQQVMASSKTSRLQEPAPSQDRQTVTVVELVGVSQATVILRDRDGRVLYKSDPQAGTTTFSKNTDLPVVTLKEEQQGPAVQQHPTIRREGNETPATTPQKRRNPVGCVGDVSPLARASADRSPSLCLALLDQSLT